MVKHEGLSEAGLHFFRH